MASPWEALWVGVREPSREEGEQRSCSPLVLWQSQPLGEKSEERPKGEAYCALCTNFVMLADRKPMPSVASVNKD